MVRVSVNSSFVTFVVLMEETKKTTNHSNDTTREEYTQLPRALAKESHSVPSLALLEVALKGNIKAAGS